MASLALEQRLGTILVVAPESPWPAIHGGRVDVWNRWRRMRALGWTLLLVTWGDPKREGGGSASARLAEVFEKVYWLDNRKTVSEILSRLSALPRYSPHIWSRRLKERDAAGILREFRGRNVSGVVADSLYGVLAARRLSAELRAPLFHRAHNIEHLYMRSQARVAQGVGRRIALSLASLNLKRCETELHRDAAWTFDISQDDLEYWFDQGFKNTSWLPPLIDANGSSRTIPWSEREYDVVYVGNLNTPNNIEGLTWFIDKCLRRIRASKPDVKILFAGSNPSPVVEAICSREGVSLLRDPPDVTSVRAQGRVLVNPVLTGSGVNVKSVEMLFTSSPIISTSAGVRGVSSVVRAAFEVADEPADFADAVLKGLRAGPVDDFTRQQARAEFGSEAAIRLSEKLRDLMGLR